MFSHVLILACTRCFLIKLHNFHLQLQLKWTFQHKVQVPSTVWWVLLQKWHFLPPWLYSWYWLFFKCELFLLWILFSHCRYLCCWSIFTDRENQVHIHPFRVSIWSVCITTQLRYLSLWHTHPFSASAAHRKETEGNYFHFLPPYHMRICAWWPVRDYLRCL